MLEHALHVTRRLYNAALQQRREAWRLRRLTVAKVQGREVTELRKVWPWLRAVHRECLDAALHRLDLAFEAFFRRLAKGYKPGYPRYKGARRWRQLEFPHGDRALRFNEQQTKLYMPMVGWVPLRKGRAVPLTYRRGWLVRKLGRWYAYFECELDAQPLAPTGVRRGFDRGVRVLLADSDGGLIENPRFLEKFRLSIERQQRILERRILRSKRWRRGVDALARLFERLSNARRDHAHKISHAVVAACDVIALEKLRIAVMTRSAAGDSENPGTNVRAKSGLNRVILDAGFGRIAKLIVEKAERAARTVILVNPAGTSIMCSRCDHVDKISRKGAVFRCVACGYEVDADVNAAVNILKRAELSARGETRSNTGRRRPAKYANAGADRRLARPSVA